MPVPSPSLRCSRCIFQTWLRKTVKLLNVAPSPIDGSVIWAGTDDGLIHITLDAGKTWTNVTPAALTPWAKVSLIEASHLDVNTAYAAVNTLRLDDLRPRIYRTRDGGDTWRLVDLPQGLAGGSQAVSFVDADTAWAASSGIWRYRAPDSSR